MVLNHYSEGLFFEWVCGTQPMGRQERRRSFLFLSFKPSVQDDNIKRICGSAVGNHLFLPL